jgi:hypothetical protein
MSFLPDICCWVDQGGSSADLSNFNYDPVPVARQGIGRHARREAVTRSDPPAHVGIRDPGNAHAPSRFVAQVVEQTLLVVRTGRIGLPLVNPRSESSRKNSVENLVNGVIMDRRTSRIRVQLTV